MPSVYRFRVVFEDHDEIVRTIDIKSNQTFEDFHNAIQQSINFDSAHPASFFMSDDHWKKGQEIALVIDKVKKPEQPVLRDDDRAKVAEPPTPLAMRETKMFSFIIDPHQKLYYVFDYNANWTFYIELRKIIIEADPNITYPICINSEGIAPKQYGTAALGSITEGILDDEAGIAALLGDEEDVEEAEIEADDLTVELGDVLDESEVDNISDSESSIVDERE